MTTPEPDTPESPAAEPEHPHADGGEAHSCEHCAAEEDAAADAHGSAPDATAAAREKLALAQRRGVPRVVLGVLGLGLALVLADRGGFPLAPAALVYVAAAACWLVAAAVGMLLGALLARRGPRRQIALGQVLASAVTPLLALLVALVLLPLDGAATPRLEIPAGALVPGGVAAAAGWFLAAAIGELVGVRALRRRIDRQDDDGARARQEAEAVTLASIQRGEVLALALAIGFGAMVVALAWLPWLAVVLVPFCAAGAAWWGVRSMRAGTEAPAAG